MSMDPFFDRLQTGNLPSVEESMKYEGLRLATFHKRPRSYTTSASRLANAGFYYTGEADIVACFLCDLHVGDWAKLGPTVDPFAVHVERSVGCPFLNDTEKENIPYAVSDLFGEAKIIKEKLSDRPALSNANNNVKPLSLSNQAPPVRTFTEQLPQKARSRPFTRQTSTETDTVEVSDRNGYLSGFNSGNSSIVNNFGGLFNNHNRANNIPTPLSYNPIPPPLFDSPPPPPRFENDLQGMPNFKDEQARLDTFNYWPNGSAVRPAELAKAGFYYLGTEDRVQCAFCKGVLRNWDPTDHALEEHKKHFPACPFIRDPKGVGNKPVVDQLSGVNLRKEVPTDQELEEYLLGIMTERAYHPHMAMRVERLNSFVNFYSDSSRTPDEFAEAGFFFTGQGDNVKCFFCDGGLRNWERNDDPWLEHARWFPKCGYLRTKKGEEYVKDIRKRYAPPGTKKPRIKKLKPRFTLDPKKVDDFMNSDMVQDVNHMGFSRSQIQTIVENRFKQLGSTFPNVESLIDSLYEAEELAQQGSASESDSEETSGEYLRHSPELEKMANNESAPPQTNSGASEKSEKKKNKKKKKKNKKTEPAVHINPIELMSDEKGTELAAEVQKMRDERMCKVCMDSEVNIVFLKCGHLVCCSDCAPALRHCPICRETIRGTIRVFLS